MRSKGPFKAVVIRTRTDFDRNENVAHIQDGAGFLIAQAESVTVAKRIANALNAVETPAGKTILFALKHWSKKGSKIQ